MSVPSAACCTVIGGWPPRSSTNSCAARYAFVGSRCGTRVKPMPLPAGRTSMSFLHAPRLPPRPVDREVRSAAGVNSAGWRALARAGRGACRELETPIQCAADLARPQGNCVVSESAEPDRRWLSSISIFVQWTSGNPVERARDGSPDGALASGRLAETRTSTRAMLWNAPVLDGYAVAANDGRPGTVRGFVRPSCRAKLAGGPCSLALLRSRVTVNVVQKSISVTRGVFPVGGFEDHYR